MEMKFNGANWKLSSVGLWAMFVGCEGDRLHPKAEAESDRIQRVTTTDGKTGVALSVKEVIAAGRQAGVVNCCLYGEGFEEFLAALEQFENLEDLQISVDMDEMSDCSWIKKLSALPRLSRLVLNTSDLTDEDATAIAKLKKLTILKVVRLDSKRAITLLLTSDSIEHLYLHNKWREDGDIQSAARRCSKLQLHFTRIDGT